MDNREAQNLLENFINRVRRDLKRRNAPWVSYNDLYWHKKHFLAARKSRTTLAVKENQ